MHPKLAAVYIAALAEEVAMYYGSYTVTDSPLSHLAVAGWTMERIAQPLLGDVRLAGSMPAEREVEAQLATTALTMIFPQNLATLPTEKIIELRNQCGVELAAFGSTSIASQLDSATCKFAVRPLFGNTWKWNTRRD
jgi:hypothetical protein